MLQVYYRHEYQRQSNNAVTYNLDEDALWGSLNVSNIVLEKLREFFIEQMMQRESGYAVRNHEQYVFTVRFGSGGVITLYKDWFSGNLPFSLDELTEKAAQAINTMLAGL